MGFIVYQITILLCNILLGAYGLFRLVGGSKRLHPPYYELGENSASVFIYFLFNACLLAATLFGSVATFLKKPVMLAMYACVLLVFVFFQVVGLIAWSTHYRMQATSGVIFIVLAAVVESICAGLCACFLCQIRKNERRPLSTQEN